MVIYTLRIKKEYIDDCDTLRRAMSFGEIFGQRDFVLILYLLI